MRWAILGLILALLLSARSALGQDNELVVPPVLRSPIVVPYPASGRGDAIVVLELVIDPEGNVTSAIVIDGRPPFAEDAKAAALTASFEPARRGAVAVAARVRVRLAFQEPQEPKTPEAPPVPSPAKPPAEAPKAPKEDPVIEVVVEGERRPAAVVSLTRAEVRELPGSFGDPFRAIEAMPGVTPIISGLPYFFVRGAPPGNVGYFLDGIRVPLLYHVGLGPSVIHPAIVQRVDLYPGGYPARFGRFAGGIVAGETTAPRPELHGEASVRLVDAGLLVEAPFASGRGTALAGGRYSYTALLLSLLSPEAVLEYWDYQARASYEVGPRDTLALFSFGAFDFLGEKQDGRTRTVLGTEFHRVDLRWDHRPSSRTSVRLASTFGLDRTAGDETEDDLFVRDRSLSIRSEVTHRASDEATLRLGADVTLDHYDVVSPRFDADDEDGEAFDRLFPPRSDVATGLHGEVAFRPESWLTVTPGLRVDVYVSNGASAVGVDPRLAARFDVSRSVRMVHAVGIAHQPPSFIVPVPGFQISDLRGGLQRSLQSSAGVEADLPADISATFTLFQNAFFGMTDVAGTGGFGDDDEDDGNNADGLNTRSLGSTVGAEVFLKRQLTRDVGGFLSYTLSRSTRSIGREKFVARFDRTHVLNLALTTDLGRRWRFGTRFVYYTGFPASSADESANRAGSSRRVPSFYRIDGRIEKRWPLGRTGSWAFVIEVLNATLQREVVDVRCRTDGCENDEIGPVTIPSLGVEAVF